MRNHWAEIRLDCPMLSNNICSHIRRHQWISMRTRCNQLLHLQELGNQYNHSYILMTKVALDAYLCVCECALWAATVWRRPCRRWGTHRAECVNECASSALPGWCTPWGSVCSGRLDVWTLQWEEKAPAAGEHSGWAGGGTVLRGWCNCHCSADSGRCAGWCPDWGDLKCVRRPLLPHCCCCWRESCWGPGVPVAKGTRGWSGREVQAGCLCCWRMGWWGSRSGESCCSVLEAQPVESSLGQKLATQRKWSQVDGQIIE